MMSTCLHFQFLFINVNALYTILFKLLSVSRHTIMVLSKKNAPVSNIFQYCQIYCRYFWLSIQKIPFTVSCCVVLWCFPRINKNLSIIRMCPFYILQTLAERINNDWNSFELHSKLWHNVDIHLKQFLYIYQLFFNHVLKLESSYNDVLYFSLSFRFYENFIWATSKQSDFR